jgi:hypothetical protein
MDVGEPNKAIMQRENEHRRMVAASKRTDDGAPCTLVAICETGGAWELYPHGGTKFGVRLPGDEAARLARAILGGGHG